MSHFTRVTKYTRQQIANYCRRPRTKNDVALNFGVTPNSAAAYLYWLRKNGVCKRMGRGRTVRCKGVRVP